MHKVCCISDQNGQNLCPFSNGSAPDTIPFDVVRKRVPRDPEVVQARDLKTDVSDLTIMGCSRQLVQSVR